MISAISKVITNPYLVNIAQSSDASVATKTTVNSIGRPGFILIDKNIDAETKKFASTKEFLYQATSLLVYMALIVPIFKNGAFKIAKKHLFKGEEGFNKFVSAKEYLDYRKIAEKAMGERAEAIKKLKNFNNDNLKNELLTNKTPEKYNSVKGAIEVGNIIGSIVGLSILAPNVSQILIRPVLKVLGMDKKPEPKAEEQKIQNEVDKMA